MNQSGGSLLFLTSDFPPQSGGLSCYSAGLVSGLEKQFPKVVVLVEGRETMERDEAKGSQVVRVATTGGYLRRIGTLCHWTWKTIKKEQIDHVMAATWSPCGVVAWLLSYCVDIDYSVGAHGMDVLEPMRSRKHRLLMKGTFRRATRIFPVSNFTREKIEGLGIAPGKLVVVPNGVDVERFTSPADTQEISDRYGLKGKRIMLTVGRLVRRKGHDLVLEAMRVLSRRYPDLVYLIVGEGPERQHLEDLVTRYSLADRVVFAGFVPDADIPKYNLLCDLFVMPVRELPEAGDVEGFGIVYLEANACGKPVIGSRSGGVEDAILENETGLLIHPEDVEELINSISRLIEDARLCQELGSNGQRRVFHELNWEHSARSMAREMNFSAAV